MGSTAVVYSYRCLAHEVPPGHPERPDRLRTIHHRLHKNGLGALIDWIEPEPIDLACVEWVHTGVYIERFRRACERGDSYLDTGDCPICPVSFDTARIAAGGAIAAVDAVMSGEHHNAFGAVRPPGHHAERKHAMGFCFFNNIAIAAEHLRKRHGLKRLAILDWDVHHGNATQHHFEADPDVFFCSIHENPATMYPGTGYECERGVGAGEGATLNVPMLAASDDDDYRRAFEEKILPALHRFAPEFLLVSTGFDAHRADPIAHIQLTTPMFGWMTRAALDVARKHCQGRLVSFLEGGYNLAALADSVELHVEELLHA